MAECSKIEICPDCDNPTVRLYGYVKAKEFQPYYDEKYKCEITTAGQEAKLMKKHGDISGYDTPTYQKFKEQRRHAHKKPMYFTS